MPIRSKRANRKRMSKKRNQNRLAIRRSKRGGASNNANVSISRTELEQLNLMINKHAEEMKVEGLLGVSRIVDRLLNKEEPVSMEANKSNNNQSMVMSNRGQNDEEEEEENANLGMNMLGSIRNQSMKTNNNSMRNNNEVDNDTSMGNNNVDELIENDESMEDAGMSMGTGQAMNNNDNDNEGNDNDNNESNGNEGNNANENEEEVEPYTPIGMGKSNSDEDKSNESMAGGAYFKRFFKSKKNKKSVFL